jgi:hypothetical protein
MISHNVATKHNLIKLEHQIESLENRLIFKLGSLIVIAIGALKLFT